VQAFNTVTVRVRVDGQLQEVRSSKARSTRGRAARADRYRALPDASAAGRRQERQERRNWPRAGGIETEPELIAASIVSQQVYDTQESAGGPFRAAVKAAKAAIDSAKVHCNTRPSFAIRAQGLRLVDQGNIVHANDATGLVVITRFASDFRGIHAAGADVNGDSKANVRRPAQVLGRGSGQQHGVERRETGRH